MWRLKGKRREGSQGQKTGKHLHFSGRRSLKNLPGRLRRYNWKGRKQNPRVEPLHQSLKKDVIKGIRWSLGIPITQDKSASIPAGSTKESSGALAEIGSPAQSDGRLTLSMFICPSNSLPSHKSTRQRHSWESSVQS